MIDRNADLTAQTRALLEPGDIDLVGVIVETDLTSRDELEMLDLTVEVGERLAGHLTDQPTYIYSGNDDPRFSSNQHQGRTIEDDEFVWECQQVLRGGTFDLVIYFEQPVRLEPITDELEALGMQVTVVTA